MKLILLQNLLNKDAKVFEFEDQSKLIYQTSSGKFKNYYFINTITKTVDRAIVKGSLFIKEKVDYIYNDSLNANQIKLKHKGFIRLKIELNNISTKL
jgi:hypothetical protein